jgi:hypothetical protein
VKFLITQSTVPALPESSSTLTQNRSAKASLGTVK